MTPRTNTRERENINLIHSSIAMMIVSWRGRNCVYLVATISFSSLNVLLGWKDAVKRGILLSLISNCLEKKESIRWWCEQNWNERRRGEKGNKTKQVSFVLSFLSLHTISYLKKLLTRETLVHFCFVGVVRSATRFFFLLSKMFGGKMRNQKFNHFCSRKETKRNDYDTQTNLFI